MNAVVVVANGWNAGWLGCYGNEWLTTPHVDRLAAASVVFDQHFAVNPAPDQWRRSLNSGFFELRSDAEPRPSLLHGLRRAGLRTVRLNDARNHLETTSEDWDTTIAVPRLEDAPPGEALLSVLTEQLTILTPQDNWLLWIETDRLLPPWSIALDFFDAYAERIAPDENGNVQQPWDEPPLGPITLPDRDIERLQGSFASVVSEWDQDLGRCVELFGRFGLAESALWMVTSGHGLSLGEHDWIGADRARLHEELVHVPLLLRLPGAEQAGRRVALQTAAIDLLPTLAGAFAIELPGNLHGRSLLPAARGAHAPLHPYLCQSLPKSSALCTPEWASLVRENAPPMLFRKPEDRWDMHNVRTQHLEWAEHLEKSLADSIEAAHQAPFLLPGLKEYDDVVEAVGDTSRGLD